MPLLGRTAVRRGVLGMGRRAIGQRVEHEVPGVRRIRRRVRHLAANAGEVARRLHQIGEHRIARVLHLIKALDAIVVRIAARPHHVPRRHAVADLHVGIANAKPLGRSWSMCGVVPASLQPNAPTESALMSSAVMSRRFRLPAPEQAPPRGPAAGRIPEKSRDTRERRQSGTWRDRPRGGDSRSSA